jgi:hypothetical protein
MPALAGNRNTLNVNQTLRKPDIADAILLLQPDASPLTVLSKRLNKKPTHNPLFQWAEDDLDPRFSANPAGSTAAATTITVTAGQGSFFQQYDLVKATATGEIFRVVSVAGDVLTVVRGVGQGGTGTIMAAAAELLLLGSAMPEGATSKPARSNNATMAVNYTQIFRKPVESTETWIHSDQFTTQNDWDYQLAKEGIEHLKDIEESFLQGRAMEDTSANPPTRMTGGAIPFITTNVTNVPGTMTETSFFAALRGVFRYGSQTKTMFASGLVVDVMNAYARSKVQIPTMSQDTYGLQVVKYQSPHGTINLVRHWLLEGTVYSGYAVIIDMSNVQYRYLANEKGSRDTHVRENIQAPDADTQKNEYLTECGLQFGLQATHGLITGVTG